MERSGMTRTIIAGVDERHRRPYTRFFRRNKVTEIGIPGPVRAEKNDNRAAVLQWHVLSVSEKPR
jgi:hypothetical protein